MKRKFIVTIGGVLGFLSIPSAALAQMYDSSSGYSYRGTLQPDQFMTLFVATWGIAIVVLCIYYAIWTTLTVFIYKDAKKHNVENPPLWAIIVFIFGLLGLLLYFLLGRKSK